MDDELNDGAPAGGAGTETIDKPTSDSGKPAGDPSPTPSDTGKEPAAGKDSGVKPSLFPENWRDQLVVGLPEEQRAKGKDWLAKRSSPYEVLRAGISADSKIQELSQGRVKIPTGKDDDPKELAQFRKTWGVPEKATDYKVELPKEYGTELAEGDKEMLDEFLKDAHSKHMNQAQVQHAINAYWSVQQRVNAAKNAEAMVKDQSAEDELRVEYGKEYRPTVELINRFVGKGLEKHGWEKQERAEFLNMRMENGMKLGSFPPFVKFMAEMSRQAADDGDLEVGEGAEGVDVDKRIDQIIATRNSDMKEYERLQPELTRLIAVQERRRARGR